MIAWNKTCLISPHQVEASRDDFEVIGTFNPGAIRVGDTVHLLVRIAEQPRQDERDGFVALPRYSADSKLYVDHLRDDVVDKIDARVVIDRRSGGARLTSVSYLRHFTVPVDKLADPSAYQASGGLFKPVGGVETMGVEDPRLTAFGDTIVFTYVSVSPHGACTSLASTKDFRKFERGGVSFVNENKDVLLLPESIGGRYAALHRPVSSTPFGPPEMWIAWSDDAPNQLATRPPCWGGHRPLQFDADATTAGDWDSGRVGGGTVPIRHDAGWLSMFHGNAGGAAPGEVGRYCGALMLAAPEDPGRVIATSTDPVLVPDQDFENDGFVPGVVFPTAWIDLGDQTAIFYGAADEHTAVAIAPTEALLSTIPLGSADR